MKSLQDRGYVVMVSRTLRPLQRGELVTALLTCDALEQYVQTDFTARLEAQLDAISAGELEHLSFLGSWWSTFHRDVQAVAGRDTSALREEVSEKCAWSLFPTTPLAPSPAHAPTMAALPPLESSTAAAPAPASATATLANGAVAAGSSATAETEGPAHGGAPSASSAAARTCPSCGVGQMVLKFSRFGPFIGCSEYPSCGWTTSPREPGSDASANASLPDKIAIGSMAAGALSQDGLDYAGLEVSVRRGPVGWYVQLGGNVTHEQLQLPPPPDVKAMKVTQLRDELSRRGLDTAGRKPVLISRLLQADDLRPLVPHKRVSIPVGTPPAELTMPMAERLLSLPLWLGEHPTRGGEITLHNGRFGPYVMLHAMADEQDVADGHQAAAPPTAAPRPEPATDDACPAPASDVMCSLPKGVSVWDVDRAQAAILLDGKIARTAARAGGQRPARRKGASRARPKQGAVAPKRQRRNAAVAA